MDDAAIRVGDDVRIGPRAQLLTALHPMRDHERRCAGWERPAPITIGDNAWFGGGVIVCAGVAIGENTVIGAGSVVVRDLPDHVFVVGNRRGRFASCDFREMSRGLITCLAGLNGAATDHSPADGRAERASRCSRVR